MDTVNPATFLQVKFRRPRRECIRARYEYLIATPRSETHAYLSRSRLLNYVISTDIVNVNVSLVAGLFLFSFFWTSASAGHPYRYGVRVRVRV